MTAKKRTPRGFRVFGRFEHEHGRRCKVTVQESSAACGGPRCWLRAEQIACSNVRELRDVVACGTCGVADVSLHVSVRQAKKAIAALQAFVDEAEANALTKPAAPKEGTTDDDALLPLDEEDYARIDG